MSSQTSKNNTEELEEKEVFSTFQEVTGFMQKSLTNFQNKTNPELQEYSSEAVTIITKTLQLVQKLVKQLTETEKRLKTVETELANARASKPWKPLSKN